MPCPRQNPAVGRRILPHDRSVPSTVRPPPADRTRDATDREVPKRYHGRWIVGLYNQERLHSAIGYVTPADKLAGLETIIFAERDRKLEEARERRKAARKVA